MLAFNPSYHSDSLGGGGSSSEGKGPCTLWGGASVAPVSTVVAPVLTKEGCASLASLEGSGVHVAEPPSSGPPIRMSLSHVLGS